MLNQRHLLRFLCLISSRNTGDRQYQATPHDIKHFSRFLISSNVLFYLFFDRPMYRLFFEVNRERERDGIVEDDCKEIKLKNQDWVGKVVELPFFRLPPFPSSFPLFPASK